MKIIFFLYHIIFHGDIKFFSDKDGGIRSFIKVKWITDLSGQLHGATYVFSPFLCNVCIMNYIMNPITI